MKSYPTYCFQCITKTLIVEYYTFSEFHAFKWFIKDYGEAYNDELIINQL